MKSKSPTSDLIGTHKSKYLERGERVLDWLRQMEGAFIHDGLELKHHNGDPEARFGMFTKKKLRANELILEIPFAAIIDANGTFDVCDTGRNLHRHLMMGNESQQFGPYMEYLLETQTFGQIPNLWSDAGKELFLELLQGNEEIIEPDLPPFHPVGWSFLARCDIKPHEEYAFQLVRQRAWDHLIIPAYDMFRHSNNPDQFNIDSDQLPENKVVQVRTKRVVQAGEELFTSYNAYAGSDDLNDWYGTPEIFADFGFVESFPQRWIFHGITLAFEVDKYDDDEEDDEDDDDDEEEDALQVKWLRNKPTPVDINYAFSMLEHLEEFDQTYLKSKAYRQTSAVPDHELDFIQKYHSALELALEAAMEVAQNEEADACIEDDDTCPDFNYDLLKLQPGSLEYDHIYTCDAQETHSFHGYLPVDKVQSHYQFLEYEKDPKTQDTCFSLDNTVQICGSFRPHYHEMSVHYVARYLDSVKRVAWVGGGDSMLLHEILKYPELELALGLELDQKVTRYSFKHFGAQPHFEDDRVEWWFGDASKTLKMLPKEYFGSFDMVLVDLSDTVMDMSVTRDLDIFGALALLLKKDGILVKNEEYLEHLSRVFDYTVQIHYYDVPIICSQSFILASYSNDFFAKTGDQLKNHGVTDMPFIDAREDAKGRFDVWHDYRRNLTRTNAHCKKEADQDLIEPEEQTSSPGIVLFIEAENATKRLDDTKKVSTALANALEQVGLHVTNTTVYSNTREKAMIAISMREGFLVARLFPQHKYCGFDLHLWAGYEKQAKAEKALINAVGSGKEDISSSSFRAVAGGMFGVSSWKEDEKNRGPRYTQECNEKAKGSSSAVFHYQAAVDTLTNELLGLIDEEEDYNVLVVCGSMSLGCSSVDVLSAHEDVADVLPIWACPTVENGAKQMYLCQNKIEEDLTEWILEDGNEKFRAIIIDPDAPFAMGQIIHKIFQKSSSDNLVMDELLVMAHSKDVNESWRRALLDRFRRDIIGDDPVFRAKIFYNSSVSSMEMGVVSAGDLQFISRLESINHRLEKQLGLVAEVRNIEGANFTFQGHDFTPSLFFLPSTYNQTSPLEQWQSQRTVGLQTIAQVEIVKKFSLGDIVAVYYDEENSWFPGKIVRLNNDGSVAVLYFDGDFSPSVDPSDLNHLSSTDEVSASDSKLTSSAIKNAFLFALAESKYQGMEEADITENEGVGEGSLIVAFWQGGSATVLWDGRNHVDINLFTYTENVRVAGRFVDKFKSKIPNLRTMLWDEQPRGFGRVVSYQRDLDIWKEQNPHWAPSTTSSASENTECNPNDLACLSKQFDALEVRPGQLQYDRGYTCDYWKGHSLTGYNKADLVKSYYQQLDFDHHPATRDTCFSFGPIVQICGSFRPHYHEPPVHYTARYLDSVKRVAWVGGGDSMLLHDILKYPTLELALGLEIDQKVTRYNFKHFGVQPHWDDDRVEWWFGDATKTIQMLPKDYFGSFDMVLIDLSDTVMDMSVTRNLDIFGAMALLLKPGGIIVKNEEYLEHFSRVFDFTLQIHYYDVPLVCSQSFILGSYNLDFLEQEPKDHGISDTPLMDARKDLQGRFDVWHDYRRNVTRSTMHCKKDEPETEPVEQLVSPGIVMIVEAENATQDLHSTGVVKDTLVAALKKTGVTVTDAVVTPSTQHGAMIAITMEEGFVVARTFPGAKYCSFDIHFWSSFEKQDIAKKALIDAVGSGKVKISSSAYRIVAGGMFGMSTWKEDEKNRGPRFTQDCSKNVDSTVRGTFTDQDAINTLTRESITFLEKGGANAVVFCGPEKESCESLDVLHKHNLVKTVLPIWSCDDAKESIKNLQDCTNEVEYQLEQWVKKQKRKLDVIVVDPDAPFEMGQALLKIFGAKKKLLGGKNVRDVVIMAHSKNVTETWRRALLDRFRIDIIQVDPVFRVEVLFNSTDSTLEMGLVWSGQQEMIEKLERIRSKIDESHGLVSEVRNVEGAAFAWQGEDFEPTLFFLPDAYNQSDPLAQWKSQHPVGFQTVFQLEVPEMVFVGDIVQAFDPGWSDWYPATVIRENSDGTYNVGYMEGEVGLNLDRGLIRKIPSPAEEKVPKLGKVSAEQVKEAFEHALTATQFQGMEKAKIHNSKKIGDGVLLLAFWNGGSATLLWDGRYHVDINLFTYVESVQVADGFISSFTGKIPILVTVLRDEQPRGFGRVVNYQKDIDEANGRSPPWAKHLEEDLPPVNEIIEEEARFDELNLESRELAYDRTYTCDGEKSHNPPGYERVDEVKSFYQGLEFDLNEQNKDACFSFGPILQQCSAYRPHYHEMGVHYPARYLDSIKRVAWVGGGDSMLLHEFLKYPTLELALGLELDQAVTRYSFKHFGTQPHWDDERVQWWYGDASKSLQMLPKDYFGSFDMVLVDLSDTVMDMSVTRNLDIFGAIALLLRKGGIIVKNEEYLEHFSRVFDYTVQIHFYDVPFICSQSFIFGSYDLDFLHKEPKSHGVLDMPFINAREDAQSPFEVWHDYRRNMTRSAVHCNGEEVSTPVEQVSSPGITMIVEAENASDIVESAEKIRDTLVGALEKVGLSVLGTGAFLESEDGSSITIVMQEGFVVARIFPSHKYCAFDVHFWGSFEKQEKARKALISAVGSGKTEHSSSTYRIVTGGMFGVKTWKTDEQNRGPRYTRDCESTKEPVVRANFTDQQVINNVTREFMTFMGDSAVNAIVICGKENNPCDSLSALSSHKNIASLVPIWECPHIGPQRRMNCHDDILKKLGAWVKDNKAKFGSIIIDDDASLEMGQVIHKIFSSDKNVKILLSLDVVIMALTKDVDVTWRRALLDRFLRDIIDEDPVFRAEVLFNSSASTFEAGLVLSVVDEKITFFDKLQDVNSRIEKIHGLTSDVRNIQGGKFSYQGDYWEPDLFFSPDAYDQSLPLSQWTSQKPMFLQTIIQLEIPEIIFVGDRVNAYDAQEDEWFPGEIMRKNIDGTYNIEFDDGDIEKYVPSDEIIKTASASGKKDPPVGEVSFIDIAEALEFAQKATEYEGMSKAKVHESKGMGEGFLLSSFWSGGTVTVLWDGRHHVDVNIFTHDESVEIADSFLENFLSKLPYFRTVLRDQQPRGVGRVVNYQQDLEKANGAPPHWAL